MELEACRQKREKFVPPEFIPKEPRSILKHRPRLDPAESTAPQPCPVKTLPQRDQFAHPKTNSEPQIQETCKDPELFASGKCPQGTRLLVPCEVEVQRSGAVVDTGASKSLIDSSLATKIEKPIVLQRSILLEPIGNVMPTRGTLKADVKIGEAITEETFVCETYPGPDVVPVVPEPDETLEADVDETVDLTTTSLEETEIKETLQKPVQPFEPLDRVSLQKEQPAPSAKSKWTIPGRTRDSKPTCPNPNSPSPTRRDSLSNRTLS